MNQATYHLLTFLACLIFLAVVIVTGHDNSPLLVTLLGGATGGSLAAAIGGLAKQSFEGDVGNGQYGKSGGFAKLWMLFVIMTLAWCGVIMGCSSVSTSASDPIATTCASASAAIKALTAVQSSLSASDQQAVTAAIAIVNPVCEATTEPSPDSATLTALEGAAVQLATLQSKYHATAAGS